MKFLDEDKYVWVVLALVAVFFTAQFIRAGLNWFLS